MKTPFENYIRSSVPTPNDAEVNSILDVFEYHTYGKGDLLKRHTDLFRGMGFLLSGSARHFILKDNGDEVTGRVTQANSYVIDILNLCTQEPSPLNIEFLEPSEILVAAAEDIDLLLEVNLTFNRLFNAIVTDTAVEMAKMYLLFLTGTSKERYQYVLEHKTELLRDYPLHYVAAMIGITPTQLSRIRHREVK